MRLNTCAYIDPLETNRPNVWLAASRMLAARAYPIMDDQPVRHLVHLLMVTWLREMLNVSQSL